MRIAVVNITGGGMSWGYRKYLYEVLPRWRRGDAVSDLRMWIPEPLLPQFDRPDFSAMTLHPIPNSDSRLRAEVRAFRPDLVYVPTARSFEMTKVPTVNMIHNMEPLAFPHLGPSWLAKLKNVARCFEAYRCCVNARRIVAVSDFVRDFLASRWSIDAAKIGVVHHGVGGVDAPERAAPPPFELPPDRALIFTAGSIRPARGLDDLVAAVRWLEQRRTPVFVVVAGEADAESVGYLRALKSDIDRNGLRHAFRFAGQLDGEQMRWFFEQCDVFAFTSRVEACPNIVLESMSYGSNSVSTDNPPMPEVYGAHALFYRAGDGAALGQRIAETLSRSLTERRQWGDAARRAAGHYTWDRTAELTLQQLELALA